MFDTPKRTAPSHAHPPAQTAAPTPPVEIKINLRNPGVATLLAWLVPGAGHMYQRRWAKGILFFVCILGTFSFGLALGAGKVVHTGGTRNVVRGRLLTQIMHRYHIIPQLCVGVGSFPAVVQHYWVSQGKEPMWGGFMAPPRSTDELASWNERLNLRYDMGLLYTTVAGLLNVLAMYDAAAGPVLVEEEEKPSKKKKT
jgi:hypothetical protein